MLKRIIDIIVSFSFLFIFSPILIIVYISVLVFLGRPVLFRQNRAGIGGSVFELYKFRTMTNAVSEDGKLLPRKQRLTKFGNFLRKLSLDELPQLFNVLKGDMSLVGPRPLLVDYLELYSPEQMRRHEVRPGITGWAQVNGRNNLSWEEKFNLDLWYVDNYSLCVDIKILCLTVFKALRGQDVNYRRQSGTTRFTGAKKENTEGEG